MSSTMKLLKKSTPKVESEDAEITEEVETSTESADVSSEIDEVKSAGKSTKGKKKTKTKSTSSDDVIELTATEVENLTEEKALALALTLVEDNEFNEFKLGGVFAVIQQNEWFGSHENFKAFLSAEFPQYGYRKAMYLIGIYAGLVESEVAWDQVKNVGWTKLKELIPVLTKDNVEELVKVASQLTTNQLIDYIKEMQSGEDKSSEENMANVSTLSTLTLKVTADQKDTVKAAIDKAKSFGNVESDAAALEGIAIEYLSGGKTKPSKKAEAVNLKDEMISAGYENTLENLEQAFPFLTLEVTFDQEAYDKWASEN